MASPHVFVQEIHTLTEHLYRVLQEQVGSDQTELFEHVLELARARRAGDDRPAAELGAIVGQLSPAQAETFVDDWLDSRREETEVVQRFIKRLRRVLTDEQVARLLLMEGRSGEPAAEEEETQ